MRVTYSEEEVSGYIRGSYFHDLESLNAALAIAIENTGYTDEEAIRAFAEDWVSDNLWHYRGELDIIRDDTKIEGFSVDYE